MATGARTRGPVTPAVTPPATTTPPPAPVTTPAPAATAPVATAPAATAPAVTAPAPVVPAAKPQPKPAEGVVDARPAARRARGADRRAARRPRGRAAGDPGARAADRLRPARLLRRLPAGARGPRDRRGRRRGRQPGELRGHGRGRRERADLRRPARRTGARDPARHGRRRARLVRDGRSGLDRGRRHRRRRRPRARERHRLPLPRLPDRRRRHVVRRHRHGDAVVGRRHHAAATGPAARRPRARRPRRARLAQSGRPRLRDGGRGAQVRISGRPRPATARSSTAATARRSSTIRSRSARSTTPCSRSTRTTTRPLPCARRCRASTRRCGRRSTAPRSAPRQPRFTWKAVAAADQYEVQPLDLEPLLQPAHDVHPAVAEDGVAALTEGAARGRLRVVRVGARDAPVPRRARSSR